MKALDMLYEGWVVSSSRASPTTSTSASPSRPQVTPLYTRDHMNSTADSTSTNSSSPLPDLPEPYRSLLMHDSNMTPALAAFHGGEVKLRVLRARVEEDGSVLARCVALVVGARVVELGCVRVHLDTLPSAVRADVLAGLRPLGRILLDAAVPQECRPRSFFRLAPDDTLRALLGPALDGREQQEEGHAPRDDDVVFNRILCFYVYKICKAYRKRLMKLSIRSRPTRYPSRSLARRCVILV